MMTMVSGKPYAGNKGSNVMGNLEFGSMTENSLRYQLLAARMAAQSFLAGVDLVLRTLQSGEEECRHEERIEIATTQGPAKFYCRTCKGIITDAEKI